MLSLNGFFCNVRPEWTAPDRLAMSKVRYRSWTSSINSYLGAWLSAGVTPKTFATSNRVFVSAICRRNAVESSSTHRYTPALLREDPSLLQCSCDGETRPKSIDPSGYHFLLAKLLRSLGVDAPNRPLNARYETMSRK